MNNKSRLVKLIGCMRIFFRLMLAQIRIYIRSALRPKITRVITQFHEDAMRKSFATYNDLQKKALLHCVEELCARRATEGQRIWFETEVREQKPHFFSRQPRSTVVYVCCYREDTKAPNCKVLCDIPLRYRAHMLDNIHRLQPDQVGVRIWPRMGVSFTLQE